MKKNSKFWHGKYPKAIVRVTKIYCCPSCGHDLFMGCRIVGVNGGVATAKCECGQIAAIIDGNGKSVKEK